MEIAIKEITTNPVVFNFEELKTSLTEYLEKYKNLVFDDYTMKDGKDTRADLNKLRKTLDDKRKEVKKSILIPYTEFETKISELLSLVDEPILAIDTQIKNFEETERSRKEIEIKKIYDDNIGDLRDLISLEKIFDSRWYNKGVSLKDIQTEIQSIVKKVADDLLVIGGLGSEFVIDIKNNYIDTLDLASALRLKAKLEETKKILQPEEPKEVKVEIKIEPEEIKQEAEKEYIFEIRIETTIKKKDLLKAFLIENDINWKLSNQNGTYDE